MPSHHDDRVQETQVAEPVIRTKKSISIVWIVPLAAAIIGIWIAYRALSEKGPTITITFNSAAGLEAGKTQIKYKEVSIGQVKSIRLSDDLSHIVVTATMVKEAEAFLSENTRFWVVTARVAAGRVTGLGTLFSGDYIGMDPGKPGNPAREFQGLSQPPAVTTDSPGGHFSLRAEELGSLEIGSPVYFRNIKVGQLVNYALDRDGTKVDIEVFINAPHHRRIHKNTRFWNASGFDMTLDANGVRLDTEGLVALMLGGISFGTPPEMPTGPPVDERDIFLLYKNREKAFEKTFTRDSYYVMYFDENVRGLSAGAPVEFRGIQIGEVMEVKLELDPEVAALRIPVLMGIEPERIQITGTQPVDDRSLLVERLVEKGLRGQLKIGNLITGQLYVDLDFYPTAEPAAVVHAEPYPILPTVPAPLEKLTASVANIVDKIEKMPLEEIGKDLKDAVKQTNALVNSPELHQAIKGLNETLNQMQALVEDLKSGVSPAIAETLEKTQQTLDRAEALLQSESPLQYEMREALRELAAAARSMRVLTDYLERHPEALIRGKGTAE